MELPDSSLLAALKYLLPGLVAAWVLGNLTPAPKATSFERVVQALIFTLPVQLGVFGVRSALLLFGARVGSVGRWSDDVATGWSVAVAVFFGFALAWVVNTDRVHRLLRRTGVTRETSYSSEWYRAFSENRQFVVLHVTGDRRLYGFPEEWPSVPQEGHFLMVRAAWLESDKSTLLPGVHRILIRASDVEMVELMQSNAEEQSRHGTNSEHLKNDQSAGGRNRDTASAVAPSSPAATAQEKVAGNTK